MTEYRASFDATIKFRNGGDLTAHGFRVDVPSSGIDHDGIAALFVASLGLLMTESVTLANVQVFAEPRAPSGRPRPSRAAGTGTPDGDRDRDREERLARGPRRLGLPLALQGARERRIARGRDRPRRWPDR